MTICIVDTSVLLELLNVPGKSSRHEEIVDDYAVRQSSSEQFLLSVAVLIETGNHVAQASQGHARRSCAEKFVTFARVALDGTSPFVATPFPTSPDITEWLDDYPDRAMQGVGLGDRSLIALWDLQRRLNARRRVYIWSFDEHLQAYDTYAA